MVAHSNGWDFGCNIGELGGFHGIDLNQNVVLQQIGFAVRRACMGANVHDLYWEPGVGFVPGMD